MEHDQRILDIIAAASEGKPADVSPAFTELVGERITQLVADRREEMSKTFFDEPEAANDDDEEVETPPVDEPQNEVENEDVAVA